MTISRVLIWGGFLVVSAGTIVADTIPVDGGGFKLTSGGGGSVDVTQSPGTIGNDGGLNSTCVINDLTVNNCVTLNNNVTERTITSFELTVNTDNAGQPFTCVTDLFVNCMIIGATDPPSGTPITFDLFGTDGTHPGIPTGTDVANLEIFPIGCTNPPMGGCGFTPGYTISAPTLGFVPEPATFVMFVPVALVTIAGLKLRRRRGLQ